jgi:hypothetical protein
MSILINDGDSAPLAVHNIVLAKGLAVGSMVSWRASGGRAEGKIEHIMRNGVLGIPNSKFSINATKDDPAVLIRIYRDGKPTETLVGHKMSTLKG